MNLFSNKKGLLSGIIAIVIIMFAFAVLGAIAMAVWQPFNAAVQSMDNDTVQPNVKSDINDLTNKILWVDKIFTLLFVALIIAYIISSFTIPPENVYYFLIFAAFLLVLTLVGMVLSNTWTYMFDQSAYLSAVQDNLKITDFVMRYFPLATFFIGITGGVIFYVRSREEDGGGGGISGEY